MESNFAIWREGVTWSHTSFYTVSTAWSGFSQSGWLWVRQRRSLWSVLPWLMPAAMRMEGPCDQERVIHSPVQVSWVGWSDVTPKCCEHSLLIPTGRYLERLGFSVYMQYSFKAFLLRSLWMGVSKKPSCERYNCECGGFDNVVWLPHCWHGAAEMLHNGNLHPG